MNTITYFEVDDSPKTKYTYICTNSQIHNYNEFLNFIKSQFSDYILKIDKLKTNIKITFIDKSIINDYDGNFIIENFNICENYILVSKSQFPDLHF